MYVTPFILIPNFWTYSLIALSVISLIQWEYLLKKHPERFSSISNLNLNCYNCQNECRFNKKKIKQTSKNITRYNNEQKTALITGSLEELEERLQFYLLETITM